MSIPRRRRRSIRTVIADLESAIADLDARVDALEEEDEWFLEETTSPRGNIGIGTNADGNIGIGSSAPTVTIPAETFVNLIKAQPINTSMSDNVGIGSSAPSVGVGSTSDGVGVGSTAPSVGVGSSSENTPKVSDARDAADYGTQADKEAFGVDGGQVGIGSTTDVGIGTSS